MSVILIGLRQAIAKMGAKAVAGRAAASGTTVAGAAVVVAALKTQAPVKTGALRDSIGVVDSDNDVNSSTVVVGARVPYDRFYQTGTSRQPARPYSEDVAEQVDTAVGQIASRLFRAAVG